MTRDELIDKITTALFETRHSKSDWNLLDLSLAALTAIEAQGLAIVPVEATEAMENSAEDLGANGPLSVDCWEAMMRVGRL